MEKCFTTDEECIGLDCKFIAPKEKLNLCRREEMKDEILLVHNLFDMIENCSNDKKYIRDISSKLSYAANTINVNMNDELSEVLNIIKRFSLLLYEFKDKIVEDDDIAKLMCSFSNELKKWFDNNFLKKPESDNDRVHLQSILSDINTLEMSLGQCMLPIDDEESLDDMFF